MVVHFFYAPPCQAQLEKKEGVQGGKVFCKVAAFSILNFAFGLQLQGSHGVVQQDGNGHRAYAAKHGVM